MILLEVIAGKGSLLYQKLYSNGLINDNFGVDQTFEKTYGFSIFGGESNDPKKVLSYISAEIRRLKNGGLNENECMRIKKVIYGKYLKNYNSVDKISHYFISNIFRNIKLFDFLEVYELINYNDFVERLNGHFNLNNISLSIINPS